MIKKTNLLEVQGLTLKLPNNRVVLQDINLSVERGEILGLVGKSGCGKSTLALTLAQLFTPRVPIDIEGSIFFMGQDLLLLSPREIQKIRGKELSIVFQEAQSSLNPLMTIGKQIAEALPNTTKVPELLNDVGLDNSKAFMNAYPHELSGGMRQRVLIAIAIAKNPKFLILDEPTTSLDSTLKVHIIDLLKRLNKEKSITMLYISHDLAEVASFCTRLAVMDAGQIVELDAFDRIAKNPKAKASQELMAYLPKPYEFKESRRFHSPQLLKIEDLTVSYKDKIALSNLSLHVQEGEFLGIIGESGSGKSTLAKAISSQVKASGLMTFDGINICNCTHKEKKRLQQEIQVIFQDPYASINPKMTVKEAILEPRVVHGGYPQNADALVCDLLDKVMLPKIYKDKLSCALSGGERQRVCIARALSLSPRLLIMDESLASLDKKTQAEMVLFLRHLREKEGITIIFIAHDLNLVMELCDRTCVLYKGMLMEEAQNSALFLKPKHPYTKSLLSSMPRFTLGQLIQGKSCIKERFKEEIGQKEACPFLVHCPSALSLCSLKKPLITEAEKNHSVRCFLTQETR